jgi:hypothetical protein
MGHNDHIDFELHDRIKELLDQGHFEKGTMEYGIALFVVDNGESALSAKQRVVWEKGIIPILSKPINDEEEFQMAADEDRQREHFEKP